MKAEDIVKEEDIDSNECDVCQLHDEAEAKLHMACPNCGGEIRSDDLQDLTVRAVGETNYYTKDQIVEKMPLTTCRSCRQVIAFKAIPVIYNGNHDVYYTGGKNYLFDANDVKMTESMVGHIEDFVRRVKEGQEGLDAWNLRTWLERDMEEQMATLLYKRGLKY
jgi:predicted RNA-binding Zn-ribbon protein involved in translation (DUF1610 family)